MCNSLLSPLPRSLRMTTLESETGGSLAGSADCLCPLIADDGKYPSLKSDTAQFVLQRRRDIINCTYLLAAAVSEPMRFYRSGK